MNQNTQPQGSSQIVKPLYPMLARAGTLANLAGAAAKGYVIEPKLDGIRCIAVIGTMAGTQLYNRQLHNITAGFPDVVEALRLKVHNGGRYSTVMLDGEIYVCGADGLPDFQRVQTRANRIRDVAQAVQAYPAHFAAFDMPELSWTLRDRRRVLEDLAPQLLVATYTQEEAEDRAARTVGEGLMLKHAGSYYVPGSRSPAWIKVKWLREVECFVGGLTWGIGKRTNHFGGLLCGVYRPGDKEGNGRLTYIGTVGTGFTDAALDELLGRLSPLRTTNNPFGLRGEDWDLQYFVRPVVRIKVRFADYTRDGIMRFPRYVGLV